MNERDKVRMVWLAERVMNESAGPGANDAMPSFYLNNGDPVMAEGGARRRGRRNKKRRRRGASNDTSGAVWSAVYGPDLTPTSRDWWDDCLPEEISRPDWEVPF